MSYYQFPPNNFYDEVGMAELDAHQFDLNNQGDLTTMLESESPYLQYQAIIRIRMIINSSQWFRIFTNDARLVQDFFPMLFNIIQQNSFLRLVFEAADVLRDTILFEADENHAAYLFKTLLSSGHQVIVALGLKQFNYFISKDFQFINQSLEGMNDFIEKIGMLSSNKQPKEIQKLSIYCLKSFCDKGIKHQNYELCEEILKSNTKILIDRSFDSSDIELQCLALQALLQCSQKFFDFVDNAFISHLMKLVGNKKTRYNLVIHSLKICCNLVIYNYPRLSEIFINNGILNAVVIILERIKPNRVKVMKILLILEKIVEQGSKEQIDLICRTPELLKLIVKHFELKLFLDITCRTKSILTMIIKKSEISHCKILTSSNVYHSIFNLFTLNMDPYSPLSAIAVLIHRSKAIGKYQSSNQEQLEWTLLLQNLILNLDFDWIAKVRYLATRSDKEYPIRAITKILECISEMRETQDEKMDSIEKKLKQF